MYHLLVCILKLTHGVVMDGEEQGTAAESNAAVARPVSGEGEVEEEEGEDAD